MTPRLIRALPLAHIALTLGLTAGASAATVWAQQRPAERKVEAPAPAATPSPLPFPSSGSDSNDLKLTVIQEVRRSLVRLPLAAGLGALLALRPRRRGTPPRTVAVVQTQIVLAGVGAVIMLIVGTSLARAFGIVGAASLVRYRAKIDDPKDAGVMLASLAIGLASGVGLYGLAICATLFTLVALVAVESLGPDGYRLFELTVATKDPAALRPGVERALHRHHATHELRTSSQEEVCYLVKLPFAQSTDTLAAEIMDLDKQKSTSVKWDEKKIKPPGT